MQTMVEVMMMPEIRSGNAVVLNVVRKKILIKIEVEIYNLLKGSLECSYGCLDK